MTSGTITLTKALHRSETLTISSQEIILNLSEIKDRDTFDVTSTLTLSSTDSTLLLDYLGKEVSSVECDDHAIPFEFTGDTIVIRDIPTNKSVKITVTGVSEYSRTGQGLHRFYDPQDRETYVYSHLEPSDARRIFPCVDQPDMKTRFSVEIIAPREWVALSNQPEIRSEQQTAPTGTEVTHHYFDTTPLLSTYLTSFAVGPYVAKHATWTSPTGQVVELGAWARASMAEYLDDEILEITQQGLSFYDQNFGYPYPWGKYDSIFVPEYNLGAMENPGLVTFTEKYLFRSAPTRAEHAARSNTILHEMAHMWFGDLVTPQWWDDLWLKESFAEFMGADSATHATAYEEAWTNFAGGRKNWAYMQDQLPTTHPIKAEIPDVDAARQNFDGITYAKGAAILKQLVHYVGRDNFYASARDYFARHAFGAATFDDLLTALRAHTDQDLDTWATQWLRTSGPDELRAQVTCEQGIITDFTVTQSSKDGELRPHRLDIGLYSLRDGVLKRTTLVDVKITAPTTTITDVIGAAEPDLVVLNDNDYTYAKTSFDAHSLATLRTSLATLDDALTRAVIWTGLWNMTRDGELSVSDYLAIVLNNIAAEDNSTVAEQVLSNALSAVRHYSAPAQREELASTLARELWLLVEQATPGSDTQLILARATIAALAGAPLTEDTATQQLRSMLAGELPGLELTPDIRWQICAALASRDAITDEELNAELAADSTLTGKESYLRASHSFPTPEMKERIYREVNHDNQWTNSQVDALIAAFNAPGADDARDGLSIQFFEDLNSIWAEHPIEIANRIIRGFYPATQEAVTRTDEILNGEDIPGALRRVLLEAQDHVLRQLCVQELNAQ